MATLSRQFREFARKSRSIESRQVVVKASSDSDAPSFLHAHDRARFNQVQLGEAVPVAITASGALDPDSAFDVVSPAAGAVALTLADGTESGATKTVVSDGAFAVTITPATGDVASFVGAGSATYVWNAAVGWKLTANDGAASTVLLADGSAAAPSLAFADDTDTGIYSSGANQVDVAAGGAQVLNLNPAAGVGGTVTVATGTLQCTPPAAFGATVAANTVDSTTTRALALLSGPLGPTRTGWYISANANTDYMSIDAFGVGASTPGGEYVTPGAGHLCSDRSPAWRASTLGVLLDSDYTPASATVMRNGYFYTGLPLTAPRNFTTSTAADLYADFAATPFAAATGIMFDIAIDNTQAGAFARTVVGGAGVTVQGTAAIAQNDMGLFRVVLVSNADARVIRID